MFGGELLLQAVFGIMEKDIFVGQGSSFVHSELRYG